MKTQGQSNMKNGHFKRPNVVVILTDDQGYGDLSRTGNTNLHTPNIDQLAAAGATLDNFYVQPLCAPTRAEFLTGRYFARTGVRGVARQGERIHLDEKTIGDIFKEAGYKTGCFGKWHSGLQYPYHPNGRGFEEFIGYCCGHWSHYFDSTIEHNGNEYQTDGYLTDVLTSQAINFMEANQDENFFCYIPLNTPHAPFQVPDTYYKKFETLNLDLRASEPELEDLMITRSALAMCENIDYNVGRIIQSLKKMNLYDDTIVIFFSDNGPNSHRFNAGLRGKKSDVEEGGVKSPCSITWPLHIPQNRKVKEIAGCIDLLPTLVSLAQLNPEYPYPLDGLDISPLLQSQESLYPDRMLIAQRTTYDNKLSHISVRSNGYRAGGALGGLYDMEKDPGQLHDISAFNQELFHKHLSYINQYKTTIDDIVIDPVIPVGYKDFPYTDLPVQDAILEGDLTYSSIHPNASYIINWTKASDSIFWEVDIKEPATYHVELKYTCPRTSIGTQIILSSETSSVTNTIDQWFESPLLDQDDRVIREESYEKKFFTWSFGNISLSEGRQKICLQATNISGETVCDLRAIRLELMMN